jgi:hypothetical protein
LTIEGVLAAMGSGGYVWMGLGALSWVVSAVLFMKLRAARRDLRGVKRRGEVGRWIRSGEVRHAAADALEKHGLIALMTPRMANDLYLSLERSLGDELEMDGRYTEWERLCDEGPWDNQVVGKGKRNQEEVM